MTVYAHHHGSISSHLDISPLWMASSRHHPASPSRPAVSAFCAWQSQDSTSTALAGRDAMQKKTAKPAALSRGQARVPSREAAFAELLFCDAAVDLVGSPFISGLRTSQAPSPHRLRRI